MSSRGELLSAEPETPTKLVRFSLTSLVEELVDLGSINAFIRHKTVPNHRSSYWYYAGGITLFLFFVQVPELKCFLEIS